MVKILRVQALDLSYNTCNGCIGFMFKRKSLRDFTDVPTAHFEWNITKNEPHLCDTKHVYLQLDNTLQFRISRTNEIDFFIAEISDREKICKTLNKYTTVLDYVYKTFLILSGAVSGVFIFSITTVIGKTVGIVSASISLVFLITNGVIKKF